MSIQELQNDGDGSTEDEEVSSKSRLAIVAEQVTCINAYDTEAICTNDHLKRQKENCPKRWKPNLAHWQSVGRVCYR